jgi:hypothetical protein
LRNRNLVHRHPACLVLLRFSFMLSRISVNINLRAGIRNGWSGFGRNRNASPGGLASLFLKLDRPD